MKFIFLTSIALFVFSVTAFSQQINERDKGIELYRQGEYEKAVELLQKRTQVEEKDRLAWLYLGAAYVKLNKNAAAVKAFRKTNVVYKQNVPVYDKKLEIISKPRPVFDRSANRSFSGVIAIAVEYGADGKIGFVFAFRELSSELTKSAIDSAKAIKFNPAVKDGKPVTVVSVIEYNF
jgi:tetratricopeptide (TPR) repeat protein